MTPTPSGRFVLRLPPPLHAHLQQSARACGLSLNEYCVRHLTVRGSGLAPDEAAVAVVNRAVDLMGARLVAVVVYGSWARAEATTMSDVDVLIVVDSEVALSRSLYRRWDETPVTWHRRIVDPHFVHPPSGRVEGGVWGEAAIDGIVIFERDRTLSVALTDVRRAIATGQLVRRFVHGQPYWTVAA